MRNKNCRGSEERTPNGVILTGKQVDIRAFSVNALWDDDESIQIRGSVVQQTRHVLVVLHELSDKVNTDTNFPYECDDSLRKPSIIICNEIPYHRGDLSPRRSLMTSEWCAVGHCEASKLPALQSRTTSLDC